MGRLKSYNEEDVIQSALTCFWNNGYQNTSIRLLEKEMGINQFSIYSSFKSKSNLYRIVLNRYIDLLKENYLRPFNAQDCNISDIEVFLTKFGMDMITNKIPQSCLMVRSILNYNNFDKNIKSTIDDFISMMEISYKKALKNSVQQGSISTNANIRKEVKFLIGITQSISIMNQHMTTKQLKEYVKNSIQKVE